MGQGIITFNGQAMFGHGEQSLEGESWRRARVDRGFGGLDGVLSVDLGRRERKLRQRGELTGASRGAVQAMTAVITNYLDGMAYELIDADGTIYSNVRMDSFELAGPICAGVPARCEYEIRYTQLSE
jgi:hypothetical protein